MNLFRIWDSRNNEWLGESDENCLTYYGFHLFGECTLFQQIPYEDIQYLVIEEGIRRKDINDKEIYVGDIVEFEDYQSTNGLVHVGEIFYDPKISAYQIREISQDCHVLIHDLRDNQRGNYKVIGNIHKGVEDGLQI